ncbi:MAG: nitroreductase family protein [Bacteroidales bacterium]|nr:nitroreductase family protein [Bacteroidales bacterium]
MKKPADNNYPINELSRERWSPRAFADKPVETRHAASLLEAARWSPSAINEQPWRFILGIKGDSSWEKLFDTLIGWNKQWADRAPLLLMVVGKENYSSNGKPNNFHAYDCGQAMAHITLEATNLGLFTHQMGGFSVEKATELFQIPDGYKPLAVMAIGHYGDPDTLPEEMKERELASRERKELKELIFSGKFGEPSPLF